MKDFELILKYMTLKELKKIQLIINRLIQAKESQIKLVKENTNIKIY